MAAVVTEEIGIGEKVGVVEVTGAVRILVGKIEMVIFFIKFI